MWLANEQTPPSLRRQNFLSNLRPVRPVRLSSLGLHFFAQVEIEDVVFSRTNSPIFRYAILISWPILLCTGIMKPPSDPK